MTSNCDFFNPIEVASSTYLFASSTCSYSGAASTTNGFTHGEIVGTFFLAAIFVVIVLTTLFKGD